MAGNTCRVCGATLSLTEHRYCTRCWNAHWNRLLNDVDVQVILPDDERYDVDEFTHSLEDLTRREVGILRGRIASLQAMFAEKPARDPGSAVLSLAYLRAWLDNAPLSEIQRDGLEILLSLARPWHARGSAWERMLLSVQRLGIQVGVTPQEASRGR